MQTGKKESQSISISSPQATKQKNRKWLSGKIQCKERVWLTYKLRLLKCLWYGKHLQVFKTGHMFNLILHQKGHTILTKKRKNLLTEY